MSHIAQYDVARSCSLYLVLYTPEYAFFADNGFKIAVTHTDWCLKVLLRSVAITGW